MLDNKQVLLVAQRNASDDEPSADDLYQVGTVSNILQLLKLPDGTIKVLVEGGHRAAVLAVDEEETFAVATVREIETDTLAERESAALLKPRSSSLSDMWVLVRSPGRSAHLVSWY